MELNQYTYVTKIKPSRSVDFESEFVDVKIEEICGWIKHYYLQEWMFKLYRKKGGKGWFNCNMLLLNKQDILDLKQFLESKEIYNSFDLTTQDSIENNIQKSIEFCEKATHLLKDSTNYIIYHSWW